ncbi:MAG TPA: PAC2 family protein [archaeon]|nr:PAC2 family protein [archaeon]
MKAEFEFVEFGKQNFSGYTLIEGFPGMGLVGTIAAKYLVEKLDFENVGYIDSNVFQPIIRIHKGLPVRPARVYANKKKKIAVLLAEQVIPGHYAFLAAKKTVDWIKSKGVKELISLSGIQAAPQTPDKEIIYGIAANTESKDLLKKYGLKEISEGITTGVTALMLLELKKSDFKAISILANVEMTADYKASAEVLKKLNEILGLNLDVEPLLKEAKETQKMLIEQLQKLKTTKDSAERFETKTPLIT